MGRRASIIAAIALILGCGHARAAGLDAKPGAWETTSTVTMEGMPSGQMPAIPQDKLAQLPPDQRAAIMAMMKARMGQPQSRTMRRCLTQKDIDNNDFGRDNHQQRCKRRVVSSTRTQLIFEATCPAPHASTARGIIRMASRESMTGTVDVTSGNGAGNVHIDLKSHWLGASCDGIR